MALALYRKYRPRTFTEVIGQEHVTEPLMQALRSGRLHHAYLFSGPRGCGKTSSARILARSLNCANGPTPQPCGECESCVALAPDGPGSIDVIEIDAASHGGVDDARDLRERAFFAPVASRFKVYVIDEAHMVSTQGFNALLKLVEEPPGYVKFVFATTEPEKVLGTIRSRTHHYPFRLIPPAVLRPYLEKLCREEGVSVEPAVFPLVVRAGAGSVRDALSVLDQLIAGADESSVSYARAVNLLGVTDVALIDDMTDALAAGDGAAAFQTIDRVADAGHDPRRYAADLLERLRDLIVLQRVPDAAASGIIEAPGDQLERMAAQADRMGPATVSRLADIAHNGLTEMRGTTAPRLVLELIIARMLLPGADDAHGALLQRLERMERRLGASGTAHGDSDAGGDHASSLGSPPAPGGVDEPAGDRAGPAPERGSPPGGSAPQPMRPARPSTQRSDPAEPRAESAQPAQPAPAGQMSPPAGPGSLDAAAVRRVWDEILTVVRRRSARAGALAREAIVRDVQDDEIVLVFQHLAHANMFSAWADLLVEAIHEVLGGSWRVRAELGGEQNPRSGPAPSYRAQVPGRASLADRAPAGRPNLEGRLGARVTPSAPALTAPMTAARQEAEVVADGGDWPTPARPGGRPAEAGPGPTGGPPPANGPGASGPGGGAGADPRDSEGGTQAAGQNVSRRRAATAAGTRRTKGSTRAAANARPTGPAGSARDVPPPDGPPFDPDYDREPPPATARYDGFDPGDEPLDDAVDPTMAPQTSHEQAFRLLSEQLGAEPFGDPPGG